MIGALNIDKLRLDMGDYVLSVAALRKRIGRRNVLVGVDLDVKRGTLTALIGPAGSGKSVTLACIAGVLRPDRGRVRYFGYEIKRRGEVRVARMGIAFARSHAQIFYGLTVLETVIAGALLRRPKLAAARARAREILTLAGMIELADVRAERLDAFDGRRLEIARMLATDPQLLLLDDVWYGSSESQTAQLIALVSAIRARGTTVVAASRTLGALTSLADDVVEIDRGKTAEIGAHAAVNLRT